MLRSALRRPKLSRNVAARRLPALQPARWLNLDSDQAAPLVGSRAQVDAKRAQFEDKYQAALQQAATSCVSCSSPVVKSALTQHFVQERRLSRKLD